MANNPLRASAHFKSMRDSWMSDEDEILAGKRMPSIGDRRRGHSAYKGDPDADARALAQSDIDADIHTHATVMLLRAAIAYPIAENFYAIYLSMGAAGEEVVSYLWHAALRGYPQAVSDWFSDLTTARDRDRIGHLMGFAVATGMMSSLEAFDGNDQSADDVPELRDHGLGILRKSSETLVEWDLATDEIENPQPDPAKRKLDSAIESMKADGQFLRMLEDRAEIQATPPAPAAPGHVVLAASAALARTDSRHRGEMLAGVRPIIGKRLPLVGGDRLAAARTALLDALPHLQPEIDRILGSQVGRAFPLFRLLLVGAAGAGKTTTAQLLASVFGMPSVLFNAGGAADASFGGTSSQYQSQRMSVPMQLTAQSGIANGLIAVDEADKIAVGKQNGSLVDVLLAFLEPSSSVRYFDPALETPVDLSAMSYVLTANSLEDVPVPLRDRVQIVRIPEPGWEHVGSLTARIISDLAKERGLDPRWIPPLDPDELDVLKTGWSGGSLRQLTKMTRLMVDGRDRFFGRA